MTLASIPYRTFPELHLGPVSIHTFGLMAALGVVAGTAVAARYAGRRGISRDEVVRLVTWVVIAGFVGARIAWDASHVSDIHSPLDLVAVWKGGLSFTGGFVLAAGVALWRLRRWPSLERWVLADGIALGLTVGVAIGRIGCISVGEHLGNPTHFFLGWKYLGGVTREGPLVVGQTYNNTAIYEFLHLWLLAALLWWVMYRRRNTTPGTALGIFLLWYGIARFGTDTLRVYDDRVLRLTGAQWACLVIIPLGAWMLATTRRRRTRFAQQAPPDADAPGPSPGETPAVQEEAPESPAARSR